MEIPEKIQVAAVLMCGGLTLVALGGCFLLGVLFVSNSAFSPIEFTPPQLTLVRVLYAAAFVCFGGAWILITMAVKRLTRSQN